MDSFFNSIEMTRYAKQVLGKAKVLAYDSKTLSINSKGAKRLIVTWKFSMHRIFRCGSRTAATSKMERFVIIVNDWKPLTIITKRSILNVAAVLDPPLISVNCTRKTKMLSAWSLFMLHLDIPTLNYKKKTFPLNFNLSFTARSLAIFL